MSETGITPYLRFGGAPNRRVQDGIKEPLLCKSCEIVCSKIEKRFAEELFIPSVQEKPWPRKVGRFFHDFACVVHLRVAGSFMPKCENLGVDTAQRLLLLDLITKAGAYLQGNRASLSPYRLFLIPMGLGVPSETVGYPQNWYRYVRRSSEIDLVHSDSGGFFATYFKAGPWISFCLLRNDGQAWIGGEAVPRTQKMRAEKMIYPPSLLDYLKDRANNADSITRRLSEKQKSIIEKETVKGIESGRGADMVKIILDDYESFGQNH